MKRFLMLSSVVSLALAGAASASVQKGDTELNFSGNWSSVNGDKNTGADIDWFGLSAGVGYFVTDTIQIEGVGMGAWIDRRWESDDEIEDVTLTIAYDDDTLTASADEMVTTLGDITLWGIGGKVKYHFMPTNQMVPYVGILLMWANLKSDAESTINYSWVVGEEEFEDSYTSKFDIDLDGLIWGPLVGMRYELNANNDFYVEYQYKLFESDLGDVFADSHQVWFGIVHQFN